MPLNHLELLAIMPEFKCVPLIAGVIELWVLSSMPFINWISLILGLL
jgi:hypothetical protein